MLVPQRPAMTGMPPVGRAEPHCQPAPASCGSQLQRRHFTPEATPPLGVGSVRVTGTYPVCQVRILVVCPLPEGGNWVASAVSESLS